MYLCPINPLKMVQSCGKWQGVINPAGHETTGWYYPIVSQRGEGGITTDYTKLNTHITCPSHPIPAPKDVIHQAKTAAILSEHCTVWQFISRSSYQKSTDLSCHTRRCILSTLDASLRLSTLWIPCCDEFCTAPRHLITPSRSPLRHQNHRKTSTPICRVVRYQQRYQDKGWSL